MRMPLRTIARPVLAGWLGLAGLALAAAPTRAAVPAEKALPPSTVFFVKVNNAAGLREALRQSQMGRLWNDPAMGPLKQDLTAKFEDANKTLKERLGVTFTELIQLPQGPASLAVLAREDEKVPVAAVVTADAGKNDAVMKDVMSRATKEAQGAGNAVATESFQGQTLHVIRNKDDAEGKTPPIVWTSQGSIYHIGTDVAALKDVLAAAQAGRVDSLADSATYKQVQQKVGQDAQATWFLDVAGAVRLLSRAGGAAAGNAQNIEAMLQVVGLNSLKAAGGSLTFNTGDFDSQTRTYIYAPGPAQGVLKVFTLPRADLRPEPWVPATAASYEAISWDLDAAYNAINDLANMFNPGALNALEQALAGPGGGEPLSFQKDLFGPLGDRITIVSDFKTSAAAKAEDRQRSLFAVALEDEKAFQNTLNKIISLAKANPKKREFQGTTIYDFELPNLPAPGGQPNPLGDLKGPISVAIAKGYAFAATEPTLLEQVLRGGGPSLAESPEFQAVAKQIPPQTSTLSFARPEEGVRQLYELVKSGQFQKALQAAAQNQPKNPNAPKLDDLISKETLPDFAVIEKYLSPSGGYSQPEEDGFSMTSFSLKKATP